MNQLQIWQMAVDFGLVTSILVFAFRWMKTSKAQAMIPKSLELEATLRSLITEADAAGRHLNEQLLRREQNLQRFLGDIEEAGQRLSRSIEQSEERSREISIATENCRELINEFKTTYRGEKEELRTHGHAARKAGEAQQRTARTEKPAPALDEHDEPLDAAPKTKPQPEPQQQPKPAQKRAPEQSATRSTAEIQRVYAAAEILLKQGKKLEQVIAQTRLPEDEVRMLSQMIEVERDEERRKAEEANKTKTTDPRLGALGSIKRQTTTL